MPKCWFCVIHAFFYNCNTHSHFFRNNNIGNATCTLLYAVVCVLIVRMCFRQIRWSCWLLLHKAILLSYIPKDYLVTSRMYTTGIKKNSIHPCIHMVLNEAPWRVLDKWARIWDFQQCGVFDQQRRSLIRAFASRLNLTCLLSHWPNIIWSF